MSETTCKYFLHSKSSFNSLGAHSARKRSKAFVVVVVVVVVVTVSASL